MSPGKHETRGQLFENKTKSNIPLADNAST